MQAEFIDYIRFGILSPEQAKKLSVAKLNVPDTYNEDGYPIDGGLLDQRLGVIDPGLICKTCGGRAKSCPGHFGHIELVRPVIHSEFSKVIHTLLDAVCFNCNRVMIKEAPQSPIPVKVVEKLISSKEEEAAQLTAPQQAESKKDASAKIKLSKKCPFCGTPKKKIKFSSPTYFYVDDYKLKPDEIRDTLSKISNDDLEKLGINSETSRPEWFILSNLLVPPVNVRPSITLESGERSEDDLTHKLVDIMRINQRLEQNLNAGPSRNSPLGRGALL